MRAIVADVSAAASPLDSSTSPDLHAQVEHLLAPRVRRDGRSDGPQQLGRRGAAAQHVLCLSAHRTAEPARQPTHTSSLADAPSMPQAACCWRSISRTASSRDTADGGEPHMRRPFGSCRNDSDTAPMTPAMIR